MKIAKAFDFCGGLPGATSAVRWAFGDSAHSVWYVGGKMFAIFSTEKGKLVDGLTFKADPERFLELTDRDGMKPAPYLARAKWVALDRMSRLPDVEARQLLGDAHRTVLATLSKKKQREITEGTA